MQRQLLQFCSYTSGLHIKTNIRFRPWIPHKENWTLHRSRRGACSHFGGKNVRMRLPPSKMLYTLRKPSSRHLQRSFIPIILNSYLFNRCSLESIRPEIEFQNTCTSSLRPKNSIKCHLLSIMTNSYKYQSFKLRAFYLGRFSFINIDRFRSKERDETKFESILVLFSV